MCEVGDLTRQCGAATPGITKTYLIDVDDVDVMEAPDPLTWEIDMITPVAGKYFHDIPFAEQKAGVTDDIADAVGGGFQKSIPIKIPKYSPQTNMWVGNIIGARFIAIVADNNEQMIVVGSKTAPMRLEKGTGSTGQKFGDENGWDLNLVAEGVAPCYFYTGAVLRTSNTIKFNCKIFFMPVKYDSKKYEVSKDMPERFAQSIPGLGVQHFNKEHLSNNDCKALVKAKSIYVKDKNPEDDTGKLAYTDIK